MEQTIKIGSNPRAGFPIIAKDVKDIHKLIESLMREAMRKDEAVIVEVTHIPRNVDNFKPSALEKAIMQEISNMQLERSKHPAEIINKYSGFTSLNWEKKEPGKKKQRPQSKEKRATLTFQHVVIDGIKGYKLVSFENMKEAHELLNMYLYGDYYFHAFRPVTMRGHAPGAPRLLVHSHNKDLAPTGIDTLTLIPGETYSPEVVEWVLRVMHKSARRLKQINRATDQLRKSWDGKEEVIEL